MKMQNDSMRKSGFVGYWSINYDSTEPEQFCQWKKKKPFFFHRIMNRFLLGNRWIDLK